MPNQTMKVEKARALASLAPATWNEEKRTIDVIVSTGASVRRFDYRDWEYFDEELAIDASAIRMDRLNNGAAVLNAHGQWELGDQIGVVERAWIEGAKLMATLRLSAREDIAGIVQDIKDGIIRNISVGYIPHAYEKTERTGSISVRRAIDWEPTEVSFVPVPADPGAQARSANPQPHLYEVRVITRDNPTAAPSAPAQVGASPLGATQQEDTRTMADKNTPQGGVTESTAPDTEAIRAEATKAERHRVSEIRTLARMAKLEDSFAEDLIERGVSLDEARTQIKDKWAAQDNVRTVSANASVTRDEGDTRKRGMEAALTIRGGGAKTLKPEDVEMAREYRNLSLIEMAKESIEAAGGSTRGMDKMEIATVGLGLKRAAGMHSSSDFSLILAGVSGKHLRKGYEDTRQTFRPLVTEREVPDFKDITVVQIGGFPSLKKLNEAGEIEFGTLAEGGTAYSLDPYGRGLSITRKALINDDTHAITRAFLTYGSAVARLESQVVWSLLAANVGKGQTMADGKALFHADHKNIGTPAKIDIEPLGEARKLIRLQTDLDGNRINLEPRYLIVPATLETVAQKYLASTQIQYAKSSDYNPFAGSLELITEAALDDISAKGWYMAASPDQIDLIEIAYLQGERIRYETEESFERDGMSVRVLFDFAAHAIDYRGFVLNEGV